jgi:chromosome segregation ATPase
MDQLQYEIVAALFLSVLLPLLTLGVATLRSARETKAAEAKASVELRATEQRLDLQQHEIVQKLLIEFKEENQRSREVLERRDKQIAALMDTQAALAQSKNEAETESRVFSEEVNEQRRANQELVKVAENALIQNSKLVEMLETRANELAAAQGQLVELATVKARLDEQGKALERVEKNLNERELDLQYLRADYQAEIANHRETQRRLEDAITRAERLAGLPVQLEMLNKRIAELERTYETLDGDSSIDRAGGGMDVGGGGIRPGSDGGADAGAADAPRDRGLPGTGGAAAG